jgi:cellulose synthase (UDP-forming)
MWMKTKVPYENLEPGRQVLVVFFLCIAIWYLYWRLGTFNPDALLFSWLLYGAEVYGFVTALMHIFMTWRLTLREPPAPQSGHSVDVFIPTYNEPVALLKKTLIAAQHMEYPHQTWLLDDGNRPEMARLAEEMGCRYLSRTDNRHAKAGNLNNALARSTAEFIAVFDADHAPKKSFLSRTLGYFSDPSVAFVQTPQDFYNLDSFQHHKQGDSAVAWHEQSVFFRVIQRGKDYWNAAFFCGSCAVIRRSALDAIGGIAVGTVTEDLHTSLKLHKMGFTSVFHAEPLAFGLAPAGFVPFLKQRIRWGQGAMQVWRKEGVFFWRHLTLAQRINYLASTLTYFDGWQKGFYYIAPAIVLTTGTMPLTAFGPEFLLHFIPYFLLTFWVFEEVNRGYGRSVIIEQYNMARFAAMAWSTLGFLKRSIPFAVTPKGVNSANFRRYVIPQTLILAFNGLAIPAGLILYLCYQHLPLNGLVANLVWAAINTLLAVSITLFVAAYAKRKRADYRFPIPLPVMLRFADGKKYYGTIDDISSAGFRVYSQLPAETAVNSKVSGELYLPACTVTFVALIKSLITATHGQETYVKAMGCSFLWEESRAEDSLNLFLYGSDMQLSLNSFQETIPTPLSWLAGKMSASAATQEKLPAHWNAVVYTATDRHEQRTGLISSSRETGAPRRLLSFAPLQEGTRLQIRVFSRTGVSAVDGSVGACKQLETSASPVYLYHLNTAVHP